MAVDLATFAIAVLIVKGLLEIANESLELAHRLFGNSSSGARRMKRHRPVRKGRKNRS